MEGSGVAYTAYELKISRSGTKPTPQQGLAFLQAQEPTLNPLNQSKLTAKELPLQNAIDSQTYGKDQIAKLADQAKNLTLYGTALKETTELDRIFQEAQRRGLTLSQSDTNQLQAYADTITKGLPLQEAKTRIQKDAMKSETDYALAVKASLVVMADHPDLADAISRDLNRLKIAHDDIKNPLLEFNRGIEESKSLLGQYGDALTVSQQVDALANELRSKGVTTYREWAEAQRSVLTQQLAEQRQQEANNAVYEETAGVLQKLTLQRIALTNATLQELSAEAKRSALLKNSNAQNDQRLLAGTEHSALDPFKGALTQYASQFTTIAKSIKDVMGSAFNSIANGAADAFGRAIVYGKNLGSALKDVARQGLSEIISGLIKMGIQWAINATIGESISALATAGAVSQGGIVAAAWAPAAAFAVLATFGANGPAADAALISTTAIATTLAGLSAFATGGVVYGPGTGTSDSVLARLSSGEGVLTARTVNELGGKPAIDALNAGRSIQGSGSSSPTSVLGGSSKPMMVQVLNYAGVSIQAQQIDANTVRVIARQEADKSVSRNSDAATAASIFNANSQTAKAMKRYTTASRRRAA